MVVLTGSVIAVVGAVHALVNRGQLRRPVRPAPPVNEWVSVLLPVRNEAHRLRPGLRSLLAALGDRAELVVLDDESDDDTAGLVRAEGDGDDRVVVRRGTTLPPGWLGKPHACQQLADAANPASTALVFVDADVVVRSDAIASAVSLLRSSGLDLVSPQPRQVAAGVLPRLVQPLLAWSWLTFLPLGLAERSARPSLSAANGQFLVVDTAAYRRAGGHAAVRADVLDDIGLLRAIKRTGGRGVIVDGSDLASCRMYGDATELVDGYTKSLWAAFGSPAGAVAVAAGLTIAYVVPPLAALRGSAVGAAGFAAGVAGRVIAARATGSPVWPDALAHPASILVFDWLTLRSLAARRRGTLTWKSRPV